jgi:hypothetical protein
MSTQITTQKILAFDEYADFGSLPGIEGYIYIDKTAAEAYLWDSTATPPTYVRIGEDTPIPPDPAPLTFVDAATVGILSFLPNYNNGPLNDGVGATLTATQVGMLRDTSGIGKIDSTYVPVVGGIILIKNQVDQKQNGIYSITTVGSPNPGGTLYQLTRVADFDQSTELFPLQVNVLQGTANANLYFNQATNPVIVGTSNIVFNPASYVSPSGVIAFVDVATTAALPNCTYANGTLNPSFPGLNATLTADAAGSVLTVDGLTASTSNVPLGTFTRVLVKDQANKAHNGDYIVVNPGSATARWQLRRINYGASGFYRFSRFFMVSNTQASLAGRIYITKQQDPALSNLGIGTQLIDLVEYGGASAGPVGIANSSGVYTYYNTLFDAMSAAVNGQTIEFFSNTVENQTIIIKPEITIQGNGYLITRISGSNTNMLEIQSTGGLDYRYYIYNLKVNRQTGTFNTSHTLFISSGTTGKRKIYCDGSIFRNSVSSNSIHSQSSDGSVSIYNATAINTSNIAYGIYCETVNLYNCLSEGTATGILNNGVNVNCIGISTNSVGLNIREGINCTGISSGTYGIRSFSTGILNGCTALSTANSAWLIVNSSAITNSTARSSSGYGFEGQGNLASISNSFGYSSSTDGSFLYGQINNSTFLSDTSNGLYFLGNIANSLINNCIIESKLNNSSGNALRIHTGTTNNPLIKGCTLIAGNTAANCIFASGAVGIKSALNTFVKASLAVNASVSTASSPLIDLNGNITI